MVFSNFKSEVPAVVQGKIEALSVYIMENWDDFINSGECIISPETVESIHGNAYDGFIPVQDGGFQVGGFYSNNPWDCHFSQGQKEYNATQSNDCWKQFLRDNNLESGLEWDNLTDQQQSDFTEYEREWFEPAMVQFEVFADNFAYGDRKPNVTVRVSINYKDAPYYRGKYAEDLNSTSYELEEFMQLSIEELFALHKVE